MNKPNKKSVRTTQIAKLSCMVMCTLACGFMASTATAQKTDGLKIAAGVLDIIGTAVNSGQRQNVRNNCPPPNNSCPPPNNNCPPPFPGGGFQPPPSNNYPPPYPGNYPPPYPGAGFQPQPSNNYPPPYPFNYPPPYPGSGFQPQPSNNCPPPYIQSINGYQTRGYQARGYQPGNRGW